MKKYLLVFLLMINPNSYEFYPAVDASTGCKNFAVRQNDVLLEFNNDVMKLTANKHNRGGVYVGAIAGKVYDFQDNTTYTLSGEFRKVSGHPEQIDANIQWVDENYIEHYAEILWTLNPYSPLYGWVWTRNGGDPILLYELGDDTEWHSFQVVASHRGDIHTLNSISVDGHKINLNIPEGTMEKTYNKRLTVLLEVQNMYTNCFPLFYSKGVAEWKNIELEY